MKAGTATGDVPARPDTARSLPAQRLYYRSFL